MQEFWSRSKSIPNKELIARLTKGIQSTSRSKPNPSYSTDSRFVSCFSIHLDLVVITYINIVTSTNQFTDEAEASLKEAIEESKTTFKNSF